MMRILLILVLSSLMLQAEAGEFWNGLWRNADQRGEALLRQGDAQNAAKEYADPQRKAYAKFQAGDFQGAAKDLADVHDSEADYNRGNALAHAGDLQGAVDAYDAALKSNPDNQDAKHNRELVANALKQQPPQKSGDKKSGDQKSGDQSQQDKKDGKQGKDGSSGQDKQDSKDKQDGQSGKDQNGKGQNGQQGKSGQEDNKSGKGQDADAQNKQDQSGKDGQKSPDGKTQDGKNQNGKNQNGKSQDGKQGDSKAENAKQAGSEQQAAAKDDAEKAKRDAEASLAMQKEDGKNGKAGGDELKAGKALAAAPPKTEKQIAQEQWLRSIPEDPGGLLRRKFLIEHMMKQQKAQQ